MNDHPTLKFIGAAQTVTGSKTLFSFKGQKYLIDCGFYQGPKEIRDKNWEDHPEFKNLDGILLTHAHIDHSGWLPRAVLNGFHQAVYSTPGTADLCKILLMDAAYLQEEDARFANLKKYSRHEPALPLYESKDAEAALKLFQTVPFYEWRNLSDDLKFRFLRAGHILGSALLQISFQTSAGWKILTFTGDLGNSRSFILKDPDVVTETDYLVCETTYGDRVQKQENVMVRVAEIVNRVISRKGTLIIPAFSIGRTQELLYILSQLEKENLIPRTPVYLDSPMAQSATDIYKKYEFELKTDVLKGNFQSNLKSAQFREVKNSDESMLLCMSEQPKVIISAAGMLTGGRVLHHLKSKLPDPNSGVLFVGYQGVGTKGLLLKNGLRNIRIHKQKIDVEAEIFSLESLSAHADSQDLANWIGKIERKPQLTMLNHGEKNAAETFSYFLRTELNLKCTVPCENEEIPLL